MVWEFPIHCWVENLNLKSKFQYFLSPFATWNKFLFKFIFRFFILFVSNLTFSIVKWVRANKQSSGTLFLIVTDRTVVVLSTHHPPTIHPPYTHLSPLSTHHTPIIHPSYIHYPLTIYPISLSKGLMNYNDDHLQGSYFMWRIVSCPRWGIGGLLGFFNHPFVIPSIYS